MRDRLIRVVWLTGFASSMASGCYADHTRSPVDAGRDAPRGDAFVVGHDCGGRRPVVEDAGLGAFADPPVSPGARPSDTPRALAWIAPPPSSADACCDFGETITLDVDETHTVNSVAIVSTDLAFGSVWGLEAREESFCGSIYQRLDLAGRAVGATRDLLGLTQARPVAAVRDRLLVTAQAVGVADATLAILDASGTVAVLGTARERPTTAVRWPLAHAWATGTQAGATSHVAEVALYDDSLTVVARHEMTDVRDVANVVAMESRLVAVDVASGAGSNGFALTFDGPELIPTGRIELGPLCCQLTAAALRDTVMLLAESSGSLSTAVLDPFGGALASGPRPIERTPHTPRALAMASDDEGGTVAVCWGEELPDHGTLRFMLLAPDGSPIGPVLEVPTTRERPSECALATVGRDEYLMTYWAAASSPLPEPRRFALPIHVRR